VSVHNLSSKEINYLVFSRRLLIGFEATKDAGAVVGREELGIVGEVMDHPY
jgi:hypothetical protein